MRLRQRLSVGKAVGGLGVLSTMSLVLAALSCAGDEDPGAGATAATGPGGPGTTTGPGGTASATATGTGTGTTTGTPTGTTTSTAPGPTTTSTTPTPGTSSPLVAGCEIFPADNPWNSAIDKVAVHPQSATFIANMGSGSSLHADWGTSAQQYGIPINSGPPGTPQPLTWTTSWGPKESDKLPCSGAGGNFCYPIPTTSLIEGGPSAASGADRHLLFLDTTGAPKSCTLYELYKTQNYAGSGFTAANGAIFKLGTNALRPDGWTSGDAAGLPILPGLVRFAEVQAGAIKHALRFTVSSTQQGYIHPATHAAGSGSTTLPPMGLRVRLKATKSVTGATAAAQVLITAMKTYGLILADNGSDWYITGDMNDGWGGVQGGIQSAFNQIKGSDFEAVNTGPISTNGL